MVIETLLCMTFWGFKRFGRSWCSRSYFIIKSLGHRVAIRAILRVFDVLAVMVVWKDQSQGKHGWAERSFDNSAGGTRGETRGAPTETCLCSRRLAYNNAQ